MNYKRLFIPNGLIFLTIVTNNRIPILIDNIALLIQAYKNVRKYYNFELVAYSIQPEHIHCIIKPLDIHSYPKIVKSFKYSFTKLFKVGLVKPTYYNYDKIWQNRYWEHTIRDEEDLNNHLNYIHYNPVKHNSVKSVKDWEYSSFKQFVRKNLYDINWGSNKDIEDIIDMNFE